MHRKWLKVNHHHFKTGKFRFKKVATKELLFLKYVSPFYSVLFYSIQYNTIQHQASSFRFNLDLF